MTLTPPAYVEDRLKDMIISGDGNIYSPEVDPTGKILKRELRKPYSAGRDRQVV